MDKWLIKGLGWAVGITTRSSASAPLITLLVIISFFCLLFKAITFFYIIASLIAVSLLIAFFFLPQRLQSEKHIFDMKKLSLLGDKDNELNTEDAGEIYQPIPINRRIRSGGGRT